MRPVSGFDEKRSPGEWGYPLLFSLILHLLVFSLVWLPSRLFPPGYHFRPVYSVRLVGVPFRAQQPVQTGAENLKTSDVEAARKTGLLQKELRRYQEKVKSMALKQEAQEKKKVQREEYLREMLDRLKKQSRPAGSPEMKKALAGIREKISLEGGEIETRTPVASSSGRPEVSFLDIYLGEVWDRIRGNWVVPPNLLKDKGLETVVVVRIRKNGDIASTWVEKKSGNAYFDHSAVRAVRLSSPLSPLPAGIKESILELGIRFHPGDNGRPNDV